MEFNIVHGRIGTDIWANTRLRIINNLLKGKGKTILDLGCGKGYMGREFQDGNTVIFAEINQKLLKDVRGIKVILNAENMPFKRGVFDYIICADVLEHIKDDRKVMRNIYDILKPKGKAIIALPAYSRLYGHHDELLHHYRRYDKKQFIKMAKQMGFKVKYVRYSLSLLFFPFLFNQLFVKSNKAYTGKSKIEKKIIPLLNFIAFAESNIRLPFGINLFFVLEK